MIYIGLWILWILIGYLLESLDKRFMFYNGRKIVERLFMAGFATWALMFLLLVIYAFNSSDANYILFTIKE